VLRQLLKGNSAKEIAINLSMSHRTVEAHLARVKIKMGARNGTHMAALALTGDFLEPHDRRDPRRASDYTGPDRRKL
jgi:DNA-binding NarL/FixJ family response regulator